MNNNKISKNNTELLDNLTEALGVHQFLDAVLARLDNNTYEAIVADILKDNGLEQKG